MLIIYSKVQYNREINPRIHKREKACNNLFKIFKLLTFISLFTIHSGNSYVWINSLKCYYKIPEYHNYFNKMEI